MKILFFLLIFFGAFWLWTLWPSRSRGSRLAPFLGRYYAHRGLHTKDKTVPENSMEAYRRAVEKGYGIELDVRLTQDAAVVIMHDPNLKRMCGVDARVDEKTLKEIRQLRLLGTDQGIPEFKKVLELVAGRVPLIVEVKPSRNYKLLCEKTLALLEAYSGPYCIESFDPMIVRWFRFHAPDIVRGQLSCEAAAVDQPWLIAHLMSSLMVNCLGRPHFIAYGQGKPLGLSARLARWCGGMWVAWTVRSPEQAREVEKRYHAIIFENFEPELTYQPPEH